MREYLTLHTSVFPSYLTIESGRIEDTLWTSQDVCNAVCLPYGYCKGASQRPHDDRMALECLTAITRCLLWRPQGDNTVTLCWPCKLRMKGKNP